MRSSPCVGAESVPVSQFDLLKEEGHLLQLSLAGCLGLGVASGLLCLGLSSSVLDAVLVTLAAQLRIHAVALG
jgi:hypothetical protein